MKVKVELELVKEGRSWSAYVDGEKVKDAVGPIGFVLAGFMLELIAMVKAAEGVAKEQSQVKLEQSGR
jgi:hypothetical protein